MTVIVTVAAGFIDHVSHRLLARGERVIGQWPRATRPAFKPRHVPQGGFRRIASDARQGDVIGGDMDIVTRLEASRIIAAERRTPNAERRTPNASLHVVDGVNHMGCLERADIYTRRSLGSRLPFRCTWRPSR